MQFKEIFESVESCIKSTEYYSNKLNKTISDNNESASFEVVSEIVEAALSMENSDQALNFILDIEDKLVLNEGIGSAIGKMWGTIKSLISEFWDGVKGPIKTFIRDVEERHEKFLKTGSLMESLLLEATSEQELKDFYELIFKSPENLDVISAIENEFPKQDPNFLKSILTTKDMLKLIAMVEYGKKKEFVENFLPHAYDNNINGLEGSQERFKDFLIDVLGKFADRFPNESFPEAYDLNDLKQKVESAISTADKKTDGVEAADSDESERDGHDTAAAQKAFMQVIKALDGGAKGRYSEVFKKTGTKPTDVWTSLFKRAKLNDYKLIKTLVSLKKRDEMKSSAYVVVFSFVPKIIELYLKTSYAKSNKEYHDFLQDIYRGPARKLEKSMSLTELSISGFDETYNKSLQGTTSVSALIDNPEYSKVFTPIEKSHMKRSLVIETIQKFNDETGLNPEVLIKVLETHHVKFLEFKSKVFDNVEKTEAFKKDKKLKSLFYRTILDDSRSIEFNKIIINPKLNLEGIDNAVKAKLSVDANFFKKESNVEEFFIDNLH